jgi:hypothetical protein
MNVYCDKSKKALERDRGVPSNYSNFWIVPLLASSELNLRSLHLSFLTVILSGFILPLKALVLLHTPVFNMVRPVL